ncbi:MAG: radical SAM protein [Prolixibacteraceae bacterium]
MMKILLNCLPPADIHTPSISLSILKAFMNQQGIDTEIKYWNFSLSPMLDYSDSEDSEVRLIPFLSILNDRNNNAKGNQRILAFLQKLQPKYKTYGPGYYNEFLQKAKADILSTLEKELQHIDFSSIQLFGISAKYNQWIPGILLAEMVKKIAPHVKVLVGGFGNAKVAREAMQLCPFFDLATWGEGEYPLLQLQAELGKDIPEYSIVPRLMYRHTNGLNESLHKRSQYLDFENYLYPDYSDFFNNYPHPKELEKVSLPINTIRSCHWLKCKFCDFNEGYKLRMRKPGCIVQEMEHLSTTYGVTCFSFVDSDTFGTLEHFNTLLDLIIDLKLKTGFDYVLWAEIIPNAQFTSVMFERMVIAGFKNIFIGYDGITDSLLQKMNKSNSFSDNLFFVKQCIKNGIDPYVNVIKHIPNEMEADVQEGIDNLHYTRFFYNDPIVSFSHNFVTLVLSSMSKYYGLLSDEQREDYNFDQMTYLLPDYFPGNEQRFHLFRYENTNPMNRAEWDNLVEIEKYYKEHRFSYKVQVDDGILYYTEYCNNEEIENLVFSEPEYLAVLKATQQQVLTFDDLFNEVSKTVGGLPMERWIEVIAHLKQEHLIYCNGEFSNLISLIEV